MLVPRDGIGDGAKAGKQVSVSVFGSTGSIGRAALELARAHPTVFKIRTLVAGGNAELLAEQIREFMPDRAVLAQPQAYAQLKSLVGAVKTQIDCGDPAAVDAAKNDGADVLLAAIAGVAGLASVYAALEQGRMVALANKESLVAAGAHITKLVEGFERGLLIPVDSEHSALFQALQGNRRPDVESLVLTASGGSFFKTPVDKLRNVKPAEALKHPNWSMGPKVTVDSGTMMNKALEVIEAHWLFGFPVDQIEVVVHPQSIVHSLVEYRDGTMIAQLGLPDMKAPIAYALQYPNGRLSPVVSRMRVRDFSQLEFFELDGDRFPAVPLARRCIKSGGAACAVMNIANEVAVEAFLAEQLRFDEIVPFADRAVERYGNLPSSTIDEVRESIEFVGTELRGGFNGALERRAAIGSHSND